jgi:hypothetical protein|tara:strand:+ start:973 stop:1278 length:306 start_codon:yes stop_codon:yes gene_type:complete
MKTVKKYKKYTAGGDLTPKQKKLDKNKDGNISGEDFKLMKKGGMAGLSAAEKEVYKRGLAAYMSSGNRPKVSQHAWAMARVKSAFGRAEARRIARGKKKKK